MFELIVVEVTRSERHDEVAKAHQWGIRVRKQAHHHVVAEYLHGRLLSLLPKRTLYGEICFRQLLLWYAAKNQKGSLHGPIPESRPRPNSNGFM